jgi:carboxymethylenebutenolidase
VLVPYSQGCVTAFAKLPISLPGVPPTNKPLRLPFTSIVNIRGDRLYHEHISWDQATALFQAGLLPEYLPFPYALPDGKIPAAGMKFEYRVPSAGSEIPAKLQDQSAVESNQVSAFIHNSFFGVVSSHARTSFLGCYRRDFPEKELMIT